MTTANQTPTPESTSARLEASADDRFTRAKQQRDTAIKRDAERQKEGAVRERATDLGGPQLKLSVIGSVPGHHMYWENDEDGKIEQLLYEGFDFVSPDEVRRGSDLVADMDLTNRISRYVGRQQDGSPLRAYLMKCSEELWEQRQANGQRRVNEWDEQIRNGRMKPQEGQYTPKGVSSKLETNSKV